MKLKLPLVLALLLTFPLAADDDPRIAEGIALRDAGKYGEAIAKYKAVLAADPGNTTAIYEMALALAKQGRVAEARESLKRELVLRPGHGSAHLLLGQIFEGEGFRVPAILEYLRFLAIESDTPRAQDAAQRLVKLMNLGVDKKSPAKINVDRRSRTDEGDFKLFETMLAISAAAQFTGENKTLPEFERVRAHLATSLRMLSEIPPKGNNYTVRQNVPFFAAIGKQKLLDVFAGIALTGLALDGGEAWAKSNESAIQEYLEFAQSLPR